MALLRQLLADLIGNGKQLLNVLAENLATDPVTGLVEGRYIYNSTLKQLKFYNGTAWVTIDDVPVGSSDPVTNLRDGRLFFNTTSKKLKIYTTTLGWYVIGPYDPGTIGRIVSKSIPENNTWEDIAFSNGVFVAVSSDGTNRVMRSTDNGNTWTAIAASQANSWRSVAGDGTNKFVAVSSDGTNRVMLSTDGGQTWANQSAASAAGWIRVRYVNNIWIAVDGSNAGMRSSDGITWTLLTAAFGGGQPKAVGFGAGRYVIGGSDLNVNPLWTSTDGINWSQGTILQKVYSTVAFGTVFGVNRFVMGGIKVGQSNYMYSATGASAAWTVGGGLSTTTECIAFGAGLYLAVANTIFAANTASWKTSSDGLSWTEILPTELNNQNWSGVAYGNGVFAAVSRNGTVRLALYAV
jgi:hypothetical protein